MIINAATPTRKDCVFSKVKKLTITGESDDDYLELSILFKALTEGRVRVLPKPVKNQGEQDQCDG